MPGYRLLNDCILKMKLFRLPSPISHLPPMYWLYALLLVFATLAVTYSLVLPLGESADATPHFALVRFIAETGRPPLTVAEREAIGKKGDASPLYHGLVALLTQHNDVTSLPKLPLIEEDSRRLIPEDGLSIAKLLHTEDEAFPFRGIVLAWHLARLVSVPLGLATVIGTYLTLSAIYPQRPFFALAAASFVAFIPRFVTNSAIVNDDSLVVPLTTFSIYYLVRVAQGERGLKAPAARSTFISLGVLSGLAALAKYHALVLLFEIPVVLIAAGRRDGWGWRTGLRYWLWTMAAFIMTAGWWFGFLLFQFNQVAELGWVRGLIAPFGDPVVTTGFARLADVQPLVASDHHFGWLAWASQTFQTFWVSYGSRRVLASPPIYWGLAAVTGLALLGLIRPLLREGKRSWPNRQARKPRLSTVYRLPSLDIALLGLHLLIYLGIVTLRFALTSVAPSASAESLAQGRHLFPALTAIAFFFVFGLSELVSLFRTRLEALASWWIRLVKLFSRLCLPSTLYRLLSTLYALLLKLLPLLDDRLLLAVIAGPLLALSLVTPFLFIRPVYFPYLPIIKTDPEAVTVPQPLAQGLAPGITLLGYEVERPGRWFAIGRRGFQGREAGQALPVTFYWYAGQRQTQDYLTQICLRAQGGENVACRYGYPVDGRYPVRAWEAGYLIRDEIHLPTPACLPSGDYDLTLSLLPLRLDTALTTVDQASPAAGPISLERISLRSGQQTERDRFEVWVGDERYEAGTIALAQVRQGVTVLRYGGRTTDDGGWGLEARSALSTVYRLPFTGAGGDSWPGISPPLTYVCSNGSVVSMQSYLVDAGLKPGRYHLSTSQQGQETLQLQVITRQRNFKPPPEIPLRVDAAFGANVMLLGYGLDLSPRWPGETIAVSTLWRALRTMNQPYIVTLYLLDHTLAAQKQAEGLLVHSYPNLLWAPGETVSEVYQLPLDGPIEPGLYTIQFSLYQHEGGNITFLPLTTTVETTTSVMTTMTTTSVETTTDRLYLGQVRLLDPARTQPPDQALFTTLGTQIQLLGFTLSSDRLSAATSLNLSLHWQAVGQPERDYTVFTQLIGPDGQVWGQQDNQPQKGRYPTTAWALQDRVVDRYTLTLREGAPPGPYRLLVGMYDLNTGQRLPAVKGDGQRWPDDAILLTSLTF